jgi:hypothetical protein
MKTIRLFTLLVLATLTTALFAACATSAPTLAPTSASTLAVIASATNAPVVVASATQPQPSAVPTRKPTATHSAATATPGAAVKEQAAILRLVAPCNFANQPISYSPSKSWVVVTCLGEKPEDGTITKIARMDGSKSWSLSFNELYIKPYRPVDSNMADLLQKAFIPLRWTKNEDFVYLAIQTSTEKTPFRGYDGLYRVDLSSGKSRATLKPAAAPVSVVYDFMFSPDGTRLAAINSAVKPVSIVITNTGTGDESKITLDARFTKGGGLLWSEDGKKLVVSVLDEGRNGGNSVIVYDLESMQNTYLVQGSATIYQPVGWLGTNLIYAESDPQGWAYIDLLSGIVTGAPAPTPAP